VADRVVGRTSRGACSVRGTGALSFLCPSRPPARARSIATRTAWWSDAVTRAIYCGHLRPATRRRRAAQHMPRAPGRRDAGRRRP